MNKFLMSFLFVIMTSLSSVAQAGLFLKSSGDQWQPAIADLQNSYNEGRYSNNYTRFLNTLESRFNLDGTTATEVLNAFKAGVANNNMDSFNDYLSSTKPQPGVPGSQGDKGDKGDKGDTGAAGKDGKDGLNGKDGSDGKDADETKVKANTDAIMTESKTRAEADAAQQLRIDQVNANNEANRQAAINTNKRVAANTAAIANHEQRITNLEQSTSNGFRDLRNQIDENKRDANAGIAGVAAMANIPQVTEYQDFAVGAGVGTRSGEQAVAVGISGRISQDVVGKLSVAADTQQQFTAGAGIAIGW